MKILFRKSDGLILDKWSDDTRFNGLGEGVGVWQGEVVEGQTHLDLKVIEAATKEQVRQQRYIQEADSLKPEAEAELRQGRPEKYFAYMAKRNQIRRETEPETTRLALVKKDQYDYWKTVCDYMLSTRYPETNRDGYIGQLMYANAAGLTNRAAYIFAFFEWGKQLFSMLETLKTTIDNATTVDDVLSATIDFTVWISADPMITNAKIEAIQN